MKKNVFLLLFVSFVSISFAQDIFVNEVHDLNDNQIPEEWELIIGNPEAEIVDGRLNAFPVDAKGSLKRQGQMPVGSTKIILEWDGNVDYSYWGMETKSSIITKNDISFEFMDGMYEHGAGMKNKAIIFGTRGGDKEILFEKTFELNYTDYHYKVEINNTILKFSAIDNQSSSSLFNVEIAMPYTEFNLQGINTIEFTSETTTNATTWLDNIEITIEDNLGIANADTYNNYIAVFPNPAINFIELSKSLNESSNYKISNLLGVVIKEGLCEEKIGISTLIDGYYIITFYNNQGKQIALSRFIKKQ